MYKIIGADLKEYGPVTADELKQWIREGRANAQTRVQSEGTAEWRPLGTIPDFAALVGSTPQPYVAAPAPGAVVPTPVRKNNSMAVAGLVCSLVGLACCPFFIAGLIFSIIGIRQINRDPSQGGKGMAVAGLIISIVTLFFTIVGLLIVLVANVSDNSNVHF